MAGPFGSPPSEEAMKAVQSTAGLPWRQLEQYGIAKQAQDLTKEAQARGVYGVQARAKLAELRREYHKEYASYQPERGEAFPLEILPGFEVPFTPLELVKISKDANFARSIFKKATHIANPSPEAIRTFQQSVHEAYPTIEEVVRKGIRQKYVRDTSPFSLPSKAERERIKSELEEDVRRKGDVFSRLFDERSRAAGVKQEELTAKVMSARQDFIDAQTRARLFPAADSLEQEILQLDKEKAQKRTAMEAMPGDRSRIQSYIETAQRQEALKFQERIRKEVAAGRITNREQADALMEQSSSLNPEDRRHILSELDKFFSGDQEAARKAIESPLTPIDEVKTYKRVEGAQKLREVEQQNVRIAPFNTKHAEAEALVRRSQQGTEQASEAQRRRAQRREEAIPASSAILGQWQRGSQALEDADVPFQQRIEKLYNPYNEMSERARRELSDEQWTRNIEPRIIASYASMGLAGSPAMRQALRKSREEYDTRYRREYDTLRAHQYDQARQAAATEASHDIARSREHAHLHAQPHEQLIREEVYSAQPAAAQRKVQEQMDITAMGQLAQQQQAQTQHELDTKVREYGEEVAHPLQLLEARAAISRGLAPGSVNTMIAQPASPTPPSGANVLAGVIGGAHGMQRVAKGGRIKSKFGSGGMPSLPQLNQQLEPDKYAPQQERIAQDLTNYQFDPVRNLMSRVSPYLMMARQGQGHLAIGQGMAEHHEDQQKAYDKSMLMKEKAANLYRAMNKSLMDQRHFLADYESKKAAQAETSRYHDILARHQQMGDEETKRHHQMVESLSAERQSQGSKEDKKAIGVEKDRIRDALKLQSTLDKLQGLYGKLGTGPNRGALAENRWDTTAALTGMGNIDDISEARSLSNKLITEIHQTMKNIPRAHAFVELIQSAKPNFRNTAPTNLKLIEDLKEGPAMALAHAKAELKERGMSEEEIDAYIHGLTSARTSGSSNRKSASPKSSSLRGMSTKELEAYREQLQSMVG